MIKGNFLEFYKLWIEGRLQLLLCEVSKTLKENLRSHCPKDKFQGNQKPLESEGEIAEKREPERKETQILCINFG